MNHNNVQHNNLGAENLEESVLEKIKRGDVHMTPRAYFTLKVIGLIVISIAVLITSALLISYILFSIRASGELFLLGFGLRGLALFFLLFPWGFVVVDIILVLALEWLLRDFKICYQYPFINVFLGTIFVVLGIGTVINLTSLHEMLEQRAEHQRLPVIGSFYDHVRRPPHEYGEFRGIVMSVGTSSLVIHDDIRDGFDATRTIALPPTLDPALIHVGDMIFVAGDGTNTLIHAFGVRKIMPNEINTTEMPRMISQ